jgi:hypothetical protein
MIRLYDLANNFSAELEVLERLAQFRPNDASIRERIDTVQAILKRTSPARAN